MGGQNSCDGTSGVLYQCPQCGHQETTQITDPSQRQSGGNVRSGGMWEALHNPIQCYMRSVGLYAGLQGEASSLEERGVDNASFYGREVSVLRGRTPLGALEPNLGAEKIAAVRVLLDAISRAESWQDESDVKAD